MPYCFPPQGTDPGSDWAFLEHLPLYYRQLRRPPRLSPHHPPVSVAGPSAALSPTGRNGRTNTREGQRPVSCGLIGPDVVHGPISSSLWSSQHRCRGRSLWQTVFLSEYKEPFKASRLSSLLKCGCCTQTPTWWSSSLQLKRWKEKKIWISGLIFRHILGIVESNLRRTFWMFCCFERICYILGFISTNYVKTTHCQIFNLVF